MSDKSINRDTAPVPDVTGEPEAAARDDEHAAEDAAESDDIAIEVDAADDAAEGATAPADADREGDATAGDAAAARIAELESQLAEAQREKQDHWDRLLRATADMENLRKRTRRELDDARIEARTGVLKEMLPVIDNLERAVQHAEQQGHAADPEASALIDGVRLVLRQFAQALEKCNVFPVEAEGKPFDPNVHEAIGQQESADHPPGTVVQQLQKGYKIGDRLLRPSLVLVAKAPPEQPTPAANGEDRGAAAEAAAEGGDGEA